RVVQRRRFAAIDLMKNLDAGIGGEIGLQEFQGAIGGAVVHNYHVNIGNIGGENGIDGLNDDAFFVVGGDEDGHCWNGIWKSGMVGAKLFDDGQNSDDERATADENNAEDKNGGDAETQPLKHGEDKAIGVGGKAFAPG